MVSILNALAPGRNNTNRNPHPLVNEYHTTIKHETRIVFSIEIFGMKHVNMAEGMHAKKELTNVILPTTALFLRTTISVWGTGRVVGLDSIFSGIPAAVEMLEKGIYKISKIKRMWVGRWE